jgi:hypothetical protein
MNTADRVRELINVSIHHRNREEFLPAIAAARKAVAHARTIDDDVATLASAELELGSTLVAPDDQSDEQFEEGLASMQRAADLFERIGSIERYAALVELGDAFRRLQDVDTAEQLLGTVRIELAEPPWQREEHSAYANHLRAVAIVRIGQLALLQGSAPVAMKQFLEASQLFLSGNADQRPWVELLAEIVAHEIENADAFVARLREEAEARWGPAR